MIPYLGCGAARVMLEPLVDGELPVSEQVVLEAHLRWCDTCRARVEDLRLIGAVLRAGAAPAPVGAGEALALATMQSSVVARIDAEHGQSLPVRCREAFADMRLLWPALGGTLALLACVWGAAAVHSVVRAERPDSLAALLSGLPAGGSTRPLPPPPPLPLTVPLRPVVPEGEAVFLLSSVVTRGGRVATYELLRSAREPSDEVIALVDALRYSHLAPPQAAEGAVNVVWLLAHTTVRGSLSPEPLDKPLSGGRGRLPLRPARS
ncbi:MAG: zf-HC2 domain-containing protein [Acidobacteria bacterium]|nr:zf-HC2 domain-containing protein [Acidobacteriota bacterium]